MTMATSLGGVPGAPSVAYPIGTLSNTNTRRDADYEEILRPDFATIFFRQLALCGSQLKVRKHFLQSSCVRNKNCVIYP